MNTQAQILPLKLNVLARYKEVSEEAKSLEIRKSALREQIFALMDQNGTDSISLGDHKATRSLVVQERLDSHMVRDALGDRIQEVMVETPVIKLQVI